MRIVPGVCGGGAAAAAVSGLDAPAAAGTPGGLPAVGLTQLAPEQLSALPARQQRTAVRLQRKVERLQQIMHKLATAAGALGWPLEPPLVQSALTPCVRSAAADSSGLTPNPAVAGLRAAPGGGQISGVTSPRSSRGGVGTCAALGRVVVGSSGGGGDDMGGLQTGLQPTAGNPTAACAGVICNAAAATPGLLGKTAAAAAAAAAQKAVNRPPTSPTAAGAAVSQQQPRPPQPQPQPAHQQQPKQPQQQQLQQQPQQQLPQQVQQPHLQQQPQLAARVAAAAANGFASTPSSVSQVLTAGAPAPAAVALLSARVAPVVLPRAVPPALLPGGSDPSAPSAGLSADAVVQRLQAMAAAQQAVQAARTQQQQ